MTFDPLHPPTMPGFEPYDPAKPNKTADPENSNENGASKNVPPVPSLDPETQTPASAPIDVGESLLRNPSGSRATPGSMTDAAGAIPVGVDLLNPVHSEPVSAQEKAIRAPAQNVSSPLPAPKSDFAPVLRSPRQPDESTANPVSHHTPTAASSVQTEPGTPAASGFIPYEQYLKQQNVSAPEPSPEGHNSLTRGFLTSAHQLPELGGATVAFAGDVLKHLGADNVGQAMMDYGLDVYKRHQKDTKELSKKSDSFSYAIKHPSKLGSWLAYGAGYTGGQAVESLAAMIAGAALGSEVPGLGNAAGAAVGLVARKTVERAVVKKAEKLLAEKVAKGVAEGAAKRLARRQATKQVEKELADHLGADVAKQAVQGAVGRRAGRIIGAAAATQGINESQELGSVYGDARQQAKKEGRSLTGADLARIGVMATSAAGVDTLADMVNLSRFLNGAKLGGKTESAFKKRIKAGLREMVEGAAREGGTEATQTVLERIGSGQPVTNAAGLQDVVDSAALGVVGGGMAGAGAALHAQENATPEERAKQAYQQRWQQAKEEMRQRAQDPNDDLTSENPELVRRAVQAVAEKHGVAPQDLESDEPPPQVPEEPPVDQGATEDQPQGGSTQAAGGESVDTGPVSPSAAPLHPNAAPGSLSDAANAIAENEPPPATEPSPLPAEPPATAIRQAEYVPVTPPNPPWIDEQTGEFREPTQNELVHTLASHLEDRYHRAGNMRFNADRVAGKWGVTKKQLNKASKPAIAIANRRIANHKAQARADQAANVPEDTTAQGFNEAVSQLDDTEGTPNETETKLKQHENTGQAQSSTAATSSAEGSASKANSPSIQSLGQKSLFVTGDPEALRTQLAAAGFKKKGRAREGGLQFSASDRDALTQALQPAASTEGKPQKTVAPEMRLATAEEDLKPVPHKGRTREQLGIPQQVNRRTGAGIIRTYGGGTRAQAQAAFDSIAPVKPGQKSRSGDAVLAKAKQMADARRSVSREGAASTELPKTLSAQSAGDLAQAAPTAQSKASKGIFDAKPGDAIVGGTLASVHNRRKDAVAAAASSDTNKVESFADRDGKRHYAVVDTGKPTLGRWKKASENARTAQSPTGRYQATAVKQQDGSWQVRVVDDQTHRRLTENGGTGERFATVAERALGTLSQSKVATATNTPEAASPSPEPAPTATLAKGDRVRITKGKYQGKTGQTFRVGHQSIGIQLDDGRRTSVSAKVVQAQAEPAQSESPAPHENVSEPPENAAGNTAAEPKGEPEPTPAAERFANNKLFTADKVEAARARLRKKLGNLNTGLDPEVLVDGMTLAGAYIESGVRDFGQYAKTMIGDFGESVKPYLLSFWEGARNYPGLDTEGMTDVAESARVNAAIMEGAESAPNHQGDTHERPAGPERSGREADQGVVSPVQGERGDAQHGAEHADSEDVATEQPEDVRAPETAGDSDRVRVRAPSADVGNRGNVSQSGDAVHGRPGAGRARATAADTRGRSRVDDAARKAGLEPVEGGSGGRTRIGLPEYAQAHVDLKRDGTQWTLAWDGHEETGEDLDFLMDRAKAHLESVRDGDIEHVQNPKTTSPGNPGPGNYHMDDPKAVVGGGQVARFKKNQEAIELSNTILNAQRKATRDEQHVLAAYTGWGSFGQELFQGTWDKPMPKAGWEERDTWLREHLGREQWEAAQNSIINAHYTDPPIVGAMWEMMQRLGFEGGRVLEPGMGIGNFFGMMPSALAERSQLAGIELDQLTGAMAGLLYPDANIKVMSYVDSRTSDNFHDVVIGNWPFANFEVTDRRYQGLSPMLHDYFFLKAVDQTRPGGIVMGITSAGTMDKKGQRVRAALAKKAEFVTAFRLPAGAFQDYAGTKVVTDIVILRKREQALAKVPDDAWIESVPFKTPTGPEVNLNQFYVEHPENVLGTIDYGHATARAGMTVNRPADMEAALKQAVSRVPEGMYTRQDRTEHLSFITNHTADREGSVTEQDGKLYVVRGENLAPANEVNKYEVKSEKTTAEREEQIRALIAMRRKYADLIEAQRTGEAKKERTALRKAYEAFTKKHGALRESYGLKYLDRVRDPFFPDLYALENDDGKPAVILSRSTTRAAPDIKNPSIQDAYVLARNQSVQPGAAEIAKIAGKTEADVRGELIRSGAMFEAPNGDLVPSDIYLGGNVRRKLRDAQAALAEGNKAMQRNVDELTKSVPADVPYFNIETQLGATWVPGATYADYVAHMLNMPNSEGIKATFINGRWKVAFPAQANQRSEASTGFGTVHYPFSKLVNAAFTNQTVTIRQKDSDGTEYVDKKSTDEANDRIREIREKFAEWLWSDPERRQALEREYNETRNAYATPHYDGSFLNFEGMALTLGKGPFNLREHQANAIWRAIVNRRSINAHEVGTGKTFTMGGIAVESRRYGIARKPMLLAHNANSASVASEIQTMYPAAKVLYIDNLSKKTIQTRLRQIANDDWDVVVLPHSLIDHLSMREETLMAMARENIQSLEEEAYAAAREDNVDLTRKMLDDPEELKKLRSVTAKELVKARNRIIQQIKKQSERASREDAVAFEDLGVDMVLVDEAHEFKKPPISTRMNMKGLNTGTSDKSIALQFITRYIRANNFGGNVHTFTGTPITNTLTEIYHQMRYVMEDEMKQAGVDTWDAWFSSFSKEVQDVELSAAGDYETVNRLAAFINVPELRRMIGQYMDVVFADDMPEMTAREVDGKTIKSKDLTEEERATLLNGRTEGATGRPYKKVINVTSDLTAAQEKAFSRLQGYARDWRAMRGKERMEAMREGRPESPIVTEGLANKTSFDARLLQEEALAGQEGNAEDDPGSKASKIVANVLDVYRSDPRAAQVVFSEMGYNTSTTRSAGRDKAGHKLRKRVKTFATMRDIVERLVQGGIPREEIAIVDGSVSKDKRREIADAVNNLKIRVVVGSTKTLGVGVNMQRNLRAMHHMDAPYMPGELEQRNGRGQRQGNQWNTVLEFRYMTNRLDGRRWQILAIKQRFISAFMKANDQTRVIEGDAANDEESDILSSFSEAAGDPRILIRAKLQKKVESLQRAERIHGNGVADARRSYRSTEERLQKRQDRLEHMTADSLPERIHQMMRQQADAFQMKVDGKSFTTRKDANDAVNVFLKDSMRVGKRNVAVGAYRGHKIKASWPELAERPEMVIDIDGEVFESPSLRGLEQQIRNYPRRIEKVQTEIADMTASAARLKDVSEAPFARAQELERVQKQLTDLEADITKNPVPPPAWLRTGAPVDSIAYRDDQPFEVTGHRWTDDGWFVVGQDAKGEMVVPYMDVTDDQGMTLYEERKFEKPEVVEKKKAEDAANENDESAMARFMLSSGVAPVRRIGTTVEKLRAIANRVKTGWRNAPTIETVGSFDDLPAALRKKAAKEGVGAKEVAAAWHRGKVWLVANHPAMATDAGVERAIFHEVWGHYGLRALFGKDVHRALTRMATAMGGIPGIMRYARRAGIDLEAYRKGFVGRDDLSRGQRQALLLDELAAHIAQNGTPSLKQRLREYLGAIKAWLRAHGFPALGKMSDLDLAYVLKQARDVVVNGKPRVPGDAGTAFQRVFHGTHARDIHNNGGFQLNKIGTGEGNQAQGWGIYFASKREVADAYREAVSESEDPELNELYYERGMLRFHGDRVPAELDARIEKLERAEGRRGQLYSANIPENDELLDWDKPLSEQPKTVRKALKPFGYSEDLTGREIYNALADGIGPSFAHSRSRRNPRAASELLGSIGIPGLRYLDGDSRATHGGEILDITQDDAGKWVAKIRVTNRAGIGFDSPTDAVTRSKPFDTERQARQWAEQKTEIGTYNYVIWDEAHLNNEVRPLFRAGTAPAGTPKSVVAHLHRVNAWARELTRHWGDNQPRVRVVHDADMLPAQAKTDSRYRRALGFYDGNQVWLVAPNLNTRNATLKTLTHEAVGHYGVERIISDELGPDAWGKTEASIASQRNRVRQIQRRNRAAGRPVDAGLNRVQQVVAEVEARYGADTPARTFAQETLAVMSEKGVSNPWLDRAITAIRQWLRKIMPGLHFSGAELRQLLVKSDRYLRASETYQQRVARVQAHAFDVAPGVHTAAFHRWFGASKTVDDRGRPMVLYHGTAEEFTTFRANRIGETTHHATSALGFFATQNRAQAQRYAENASGGVPAEEQVMDLYMAIRKPYTMSLDEAQAIETTDQAAAVRKHLEKAGYDGIRMPESGSWIAFRPEQIKSASGNVGTFDASNPDIRFSFGQPGDEVKVTSVPGGKFGSVSTPKARRIARSGAHAYLESLRHQGVELTNRQTGWKIGFSAKGNRELKTWSARPERIEALAALPALMRRAVLGDSQVNENPSATDATVAYHYFYAPLRIGNETRIARLVVREERNGHYAYDLQQSDVLDNKNPAEMQRRPATKAGTEAPQTGSTMTITQLRDRVNAVEKQGWHFREGSRMPTSTGATGATSTGNFSLSAASLDTADKVIQASDDDRNSVEKVKDWLAGKFEDIKPALLGTLQLRHLLELMEDHKPLAGAQAYAHVMQRMDADRNQLLQGAPDADQHPKDMLRKGVANIQKDWQKWAFTKSVLGLGRKKAQAEDLEAIMHDATRMGMDPDKDFEKIRIDDGTGNFVPWTKERLRDRIKHLRAIARSNPGDDKSMLMDEVKQLRGIPKREKLREELWPDLKRRYDALPEEAKQTYREVRDWYQQHADETEKALISRIEAMDMPETYRRSMADRIRLRFEMNRREGVYFPLDRNGDYWISYSDLDGAQGFLMLESAAELKKAERAIRKRGWTVEGTGRRNKNYQAKNAPSGTFVKEIIQQLQKAGVNVQVQNDIYQTFLKTLPEVSMRKHHIRRKSVPGFSGDAMRAFAKNGFHGSYQLARLRWSQRMQMILEGMKAKVDEYRSADELGNSAEATGNETAKLDALLGELDKRHEWIMNPTDSQLANKATSIGFFWYLGASPASALVNLLQGAQVTLPVLGARHGWGKASRMLGAATRQAMRTRGDMLKTLKTDDDRQAYMELLKRGDIDRTQGHTLAAVAEGNELANNPQWERVMRGMSWMFHTAEVINRSAAGVAAYRLARAEGKNHREAVEYASEIINGTHFDYSNANRPRFMQKGWQKVLLQFKNYSYSMTWVMYRNLYQSFKGESPEVRRQARRTLTGVLGMTGLLAGVVGLPIINLIAFAANAAHAIGGDDDKPWDFMTEFRAWLAEHFGETAANVIADGAVDQLGLNISSRVSLSDLWFRDSDRQLEGSDAYHQLLDSLAGPTGSIVKNAFYVGPQYISEGHIWRGVERMLPTFAKNGMKAFRYATQGVNTLRGDPIISDVSTAGDFIQALGFRPTSVAEQQRINSSLMNYNQQVQDRRKTLLNAYAMSIHMQDAAARRKALEKIRHFNGEWPRIAITGSTIRRSLRGRARYSQQALHGMPVDKRLQNRLEEIVQPAAAAKGE